MRLEGSKRRTGAPTPSYRSPLHGPPVEGRERDWLRFQVQAHHPKRYWEPVSQSDDRNRALLDALKRARVGNVAYRVWDRLERKEIWRGFGYGATIDEWIKDRPAGLVGQNRRAAMKRSAKRWLYVEDHQGRHIGKTFGLPSAMARELTKKKLHWVVARGGRNYVLYRVYGLASKRRARANAPDEQPTFHVMHVSVDGAGYSRRDLPTKKQAIAIAQKRQAFSDRGGNPWGYHYIVYREYPSGRSDAIYRTKSRARANWNGSRRRKIALMNSPAANPRAVHKAIVSAFLGGQSRRIGARYATSGGELRVWGNLVASKVPGGIRIRDAGYRTLLTKNVLNEILDQLKRGRIYQKGGSWYVSTPLGSVPWTGEWTITRGTAARRPASRLLLAPGALQSAMKFA